MHEQSLRYVRVQDINEERVVLEEIVGLETAAITDSEVRKEFAVVGWGGSGGQKRGYELVLIIGCVATSYNWQGCNLRWGENKLDGEQEIS